MFWLLIVGSPVFTAHLLLKGEKKKIKHSNAYTEKEKNILKWTLFRFTHFKTDQQLSFESCHGEGKITAAQNYLIS